MAKAIIVRGLEVPAHPEAGVDFDHADLQFHQVDHSGHSYEVRVYLNNSSASEETGRDAAAGYAGSFHIFGHGGCYGDEGHCDPARRGQHPFDYRLAHPNEPMMKSLEVTEALKRLRDQGESKIDVTLVPIVYSSSVPTGRHVREELKLESVGLVTYETSGA
jgi:hypothetical protein